MARKDYNRLKTLVNQMDRTHMETHLHDVRIHMKRVRYTAELAGPVLGKSVTRFLKQAKHLQDLLGSHQDAVIAETRLTELLRASRSARMAFVSGLIVARLRKQRSMVLDAFPGQWKKLEKRAKGLGKVTL
jgi:CHAD domain-containing protein